MEPKNKIAEEQSKKDWEVYNERRIEKEEELIKCYQEVLIIELAKLDYEFRSYSEGEGFVITDDDKKVIASLPGFKIEIIIGEPIPTNLYQFEMAIIIPGCRNEYRIVLQLLKQFYFPRQTVKRQKPRVKTLIDADIWKILDEIDLMNRTLEHKKQIQYSLSYYNVKNENQDFNRQKKFKSFTSILDDLLTEYRV